MSSANTQQLEAASYILPPETQNEIMRYCSRKDLTSLARIHSAYRAVAETILYETVKLDIAGESYEQTMVKSVVGRAQLVKNLLVAIVSSTADHYVVTLKILYEHFSEMVNLQDLRIELAWIYYPDKHLQVLERITDELNGILRQNHFPRLKTLFCDYHLDIPAIIGQYGQQLQFFAINLDSKAHLGTAIRHIPKFYRCNDGTNGRRRPAALLNRDDKIFTIFPALDRTMTFPTTVENETLPLLRRFIDLGPDRSRPVFEFPNDINTIALVYQDVHDLARSLKSGFVSTTTKTSSIPLRCARELKIVLLEDHQFDEFPDLIPLLEHFQEHLMTFSLQVYPLDPRPLTSSLLNIGRMGLFGRYKVICPKLETLNLDLGAARQVHVIVRQVRRSNGA